MILTGCLSVISGVITAYYHYRQSSVEVPIWMFKLYHIARPNKWSQDIPSIVNMSDEPDHSNISIATMAAEIKNCNVIQDIKEEKNESEKKQDDGTINTAGSIQIHGKEMAVMVNKLLMLTCLFLTSISMIVTACAFIAS